MLEQSEIDKLLAEYQTYKSELRELKNKMNDLSRKKEQLFDKKRTISSNIFSRIKDAKSSKDKRNSLTSVVKNIKMTKEEVMVEIPKLEAEIKRLKEQKRVTLEKLGVSDPAAMKREIKHIEFKIQTEAMSFEKEKELMKVLSKMKKQSEGLKSLEDVNKQLDEHYAKLRDFRAQVDMNAKIVQHSARESQKHHESMMESSKEIDELKKEEFDLEEKIGTHKEELSTLHDTFQKKQDEAEVLRLKLAENNVRLREDQDKASSELLRQKDQEVQQKLKTGKKLTTEDLLILQKTMK